MSNYRGYKGEAINSIPHYIIDIIYKTVRPSHLEKLQTIQNIYNLMFHIIFIFFDWILIKQIIVFSSFFCCWGKQISKKNLSEVLSGSGGWALVKMPRFNAFSWNVNTINLNTFHTHGGIFKLEKIQQQIWREIKL